tara:strand:- start:1579 stop:1842 length:264 start_codon:yes stop_codon:yes gene_type:complete
MYNKIKNVGIVLIFFISFIFALKYYFSEKNIIFVNKSRLSYHTKINNYEIDLPKLKNDTNNIIVYVDGLEDFKKKRKKRFWEKLISD